MSVLTSNLRSGGGETAVRVWSPTRDNQTGHWTFGWIAISNEGGKVEI
jgi:hypothetical protein